MGCRTIIPLLVSLAFLACGCLLPNLRVSVAIPAAYGGDGTGGEPVRVCYTKAYQDFWWSCVRTRAEQLQNRCPSICGGSRAAEAGCAQGAQDAERQIDDQIRTYGPDAVQRLLQTMARQDRAIAGKMPCLSAPEPAGGQATCKK
jgi:hypothetical protein